MQRETLNVRDVATQLGVQEATVRRAVRAGMLPAIRIGRRLVIPRRAVERLLNGLIPPHTEPEVSRHDD